MASGIGMCYSCIAGKGVMDFPHAWCPNCKSRVAKPRVICNLGIISVENPLQLVYVVSPAGCNFHYSLTDLSVDCNDITALVSGEQKHYFHLWGLQKPLVAFATRDFFRPHSWKQCFFTLLSPHSNTTLPPIQLCRSIITITIVRGE
jgi:hypothetical protein